MLDMPNDDDLRQLQEGVASMRATLGEMQRHLDRINGRLHEAEQNINRMGGAQGRVSTSTVWVAVGSLGFIGSIVVTLVLGL